MEQPEHHTLLILTLKHPWTRDRFLGGSRKTINGMGRKGKGYDYPPDVSHGWLTFPEAIEKHPAYISDVTLLSFSRRPLLYLLPSK